MTGGLGTIHDKNQIFVYFIVNMSYNYYFTQLGHFIVPVMFSLYDFETQDVEFQTGPKQIRLSISAWSSKVTRSACSWKNFLRLFCRAAKNIVSGSKLSSNRTMIRPQWDHNFLGDKFTEVGGIRKPTGLTFQCKECCILEFDGPLNAIREIVLRHGAWKAYFLSCI